MIVRLWLRVASIVAGAVALVALAVMPTADAAPSDDARYLTLLTENGIHVSSVPYAIEQGHAVCDLLDNGWTLVEVVDAADRVFTVNQDGAVVIVGSAVLAYCPWYAPKLKRAV